MKNLSEEMKWEELKEKLDNEIPIVTLGGLVQYYDPDTKWISRPSKVGAIILDGDSVSVYHKETGWISGRYKVTINEGKGITFIREVSEEEEKGE